MSAGPEEPLSSELFSDVEEYIVGVAGRVRNWSSEDDDPESDLLSDAHPLVAFCHDVLEQLSRSELRQPVDGFGRSARRVLIAERRRLERRGRSPELQRVLLELDVVASFLDTASYARSEEETSEFLASDFLALLRALASYLEAEWPETDAASTAASALDELEHYLGIAEK